MLERNQIKVKSVKKTIDVLNSFLQDEYLGVTEIASRLNLSKSNAYDILTTLVALDYLGQDTVSEKYYLSVGAIRLSRGVGSRYSFRNIAKPFMQDLANMEKKEVSLTVPFNNEIFYLESVIPSKMGIYTPKKMRSYTCRMHCTASGKCMLANMPREYVMQYMASGLEKYTENTITNDIVFLQALDNILKEGYAIDYYEWSQDYGCIGVPLFSPFHKLIGAISINMTSDIENKQEVLRIKEHLIDISNQITNLMSGGRE